VNDVLLWWGLPGACAKPCYRIMSSTVGGLLSLNVYGMIYCNTPGVTVSSTYLYSGATVNPNSSWNSNPNLTLCEFFFLLYLPLVKELQIFEYK
jgi:hypothetical protein